MSSIARLHGQYVRVCHWFESPLLLLIRLYWGWQFAETGWGKLHHIHHVIAFFSSLGLPFPAIMAPFVSAVELVGGILLILGLWSHITGLVLAIDMLVAYWVGDRAALGSIFSDPGKFYGADPYTFFFASLIVLIFGAGLFSLDAILDRKK